MSSQRISIEVEPLASCHSHFRDDLEVQYALLRLAIQGGSDIVGAMPNPGNGLRTVRQVLDYMNGLLTLVPGRGGNELKILPFIALTPTTPLRELQKAKEAGIDRVKIYPYKRTTNSELLGVRHYIPLIEHIKLCGDLGIDVHKHPEHPWLTIDSRDAEYMFLPIADMLLNECPKTRFFWEHGTDARCIPFWKEMATTERFILTLTAHHLATHEDEVFGDPRGTVKPPIKPRRDMMGLVDLVMENHPWVIAGPDDAPHPRESKHPDSGRCSCGAFTTPFLHLLYAHALDKLLKTPHGIETYINFTSRNIRKLLNLSAASRQITLVRKPFMIPATYEAGPWTIESFMAKEKLLYSIAV